MSNKHIGDYQSTRRISAGGAFNFPDWQPNFEYKVNDLFVESGVLYTVSSDFTSGVSFDANNVNHTKSGGTSTQADTTYDNSGSTLSATNGRDALDELDAKIEGLGTVEHQASDIAARDALVGLIAGDRVFVVDASSDPTVASGWAVYRWDGFVFLKLAEAESLDLVIDSQGLRGEPVADNTALTALTARNYERRKVLADGKEYVFELGAVSGTLADDGATGFWQEQIVQGLATNDLAASTVLAEATGSGLSFIYEVIATSDTITAPSSTVGGVASYAASNHPAGTKILVSDSAAGEWDVSVVGASTQTGLHYASISSTQNNLVTAPSGVFDYGNSNLIINDENSLLDMVNDKAVIKQSGKYFLMFSAASLGQSGGFSLDIEIKVNGILVASSMLQNPTTSSFLTAPVTWQGNLQENDEVQFVATGASQVRTPSFVIQQLPTTEAVLAGMVTPEVLTYVHFGSTTQKTTQGNNNDYLTADVINFDINGAVAANGTFTAPSAGLYQINVSVDAANNGTTGNNSHFTSYEYEVNGGTPQKLSNVQYTPEMNDYIDRNNYTAFGYVELSAGDALRILIADDATTEPTFMQDLFGYDVLIQQLPTSTVVMPDALDVEDNRVLLGSGSNLASNSDITISDTWGNLANQYEKVQIEFIGTVNGLNLRQDVTLNTDGWIDGTRAVFVSDQTNVIVIRNMDIAGNTANLFMSTTGSGLNGDVNIYGVKAQKTVINSNEVTIIDTSASGYQDIPGTNMRIQWGVVSDGNSNSDVSVTLPAAFANTNYVITATNRTPGQEYGVGARPNTTNSFFLNRNDSATATSDWNWQAIGLKP
jgi:hypothetical protein